MSDDTAASVPRHLGLILDGNRRWARANGKTIIQGHEAGYFTLKTIARSAIRQGVEYVSAFIFSTENWKRERLEVRDLMKLLLWVLRHEIDELDEEGIRIRVIGSRSKIGTLLAKTIEKAETRTANNTAGTLLLYLDYGGQQEIVEAVKGIIAEGHKAEDVTAELISQHLYIPDVPPVDLLIRTSGEQRLSNFMIWEVAYSELLFLPMYWPDFTEADLQAAFADYRSRQRRFGN